MTPLASLPSAHTSGLRFVVVLLLASLLAGCGGTQVDVQLDTPVAAAAARVEIVQTGLLFSERGQTRQLVARVFDAEGARLDTAVSWSASDPANISVGGDGMARAERASGSSQIVAAVGELRSAPLLAVVTTVATGTVLVSDEQVVRGPVETDPDAEPSLDNTYTVVVSGIDAPAVGTLMSGTGSQPIAGRVVSTREVTGGIEVTLKLAPLPELFPGLKINQRFDLSQVPVIVPDSVTASYEVLREGDTYTFTPRAGVSQAAKLGVPAGTGALFDQGCESAAGGAGFGDGAPPFVFEPQPVFSFTIAPAVDVLYTEARGLERFLATAEPSFLIDGTIKSTLAFEGKIGCKAELLVFRIPVGGPLSALISGLVPVGVGFEVGGKVTVAQLKLGFSSRTSAKAAVGIACDGECKFVNELTDFVNTNTPTVDLPGGEDFRVKPELTAFGYVEVAVGNPIFKSLKFSAFEFKAGPKLEGEFAPVATQIAATDFKASYKLSLGINAGFGDDIENVLNILGVVKVGDEVLEKTTDLANSPTGVLTVDRDRFVTGETAQFTLKLDPAAVEFLGLYNVSDIVLIRNSGGQREVARAPATSGQTTFNFTFIAPDAGQTKEFTAFAVTRLLPVDLLSLELDTASVANTAPVAVDDSATVTVDSAAATILVLANDSDADGDTLTLGSVSQPARGTVSISNAGKALSYRPASGFVGTETFQYTVIDGKGGGDEGVVTVQVQAAPASLRLTSAFIGSRADATACPIVRNGVCASPAPLFEERRIYDETSGIPASDQTSVSAEAAFEGRSVNVDTDAALMIDGAADAPRQIDLRCNTSGDGTGDGGNRDLAYGGSSSSGSGVNFSVQGEGSVRYEISVLSTASGAFSPSLGRASATVAGGLLNRFEVSHNNLEGRIETGEASGFLGSGGYTLEVTCVGSVSDEGGSVSSNGTVRLTLMP